MVEVEEVEVEVEVEVAEEGEEEVVEEVKAEAVVEGAPASLSSSAVSRSPPPLQRTPLLSSTWTDAVRVPEATRR